MKDHVPLLVRLLLTEPWWRFDAQRAGLWDHAYHTFNLCEGLIWLGFAFLVLRRRQIHRRSPWELAYAAAFLVFAGTDFREAFVQSAPLVLLKAVVLGVLWWLRRRVIRLYEGKFWW